jgi:restriction system protein
LNLLARLIRSRKERLLARSRADFEKDRADWAAAVAKIERDYRNAHETHVRALAELQAEYAAQVASWQAREAEYSATQAAANGAVDDKCSKYQAADPVAIGEYCDLVLSRSRYPEYFPQEFELEYEVSSKTLVVDYVLPAPEAIPTLRAVKYLANRDDFEEQHISDTQAAKLYDEVLYQVVLRTVHELFEADRIDALSAVVLNGIVSSVNRATGRSETACVLSLRASREEFVAINLAQIDPKSCFKALKGVAAAKLHGLSPVPPIMPLQREDARFVSSYSVGAGLAEGDNLAAMDWEDFEHLIREVFEKEFASTGGEVKVTRASRDGGVDAVAFDPDPIRGGKIVIQAKRYTNTVGVSAVRDLYGTVLNEGATKGVLVTTSDYGPDSYAFASGKPLVLLSGANLLHMLEKHGRRARIDLREAKKYFES